MGVGRKTLQTVPFKLDFVIVVEIIDADNLVAPVQEAVRQRRADKTGGAGDQYLHCHALSVGGCGLDIMARILKQQVLTG